MDVQFHRGTLSVVFAPTGVQTVANPVDGSGRNLVSSYRYGPCNGLTGNPCAFSPISHLGLNEWLGQSGAAAVSWMSLILKLSQMHNRVAQLTRCIVVVGPTPQKIQREKKKKKKEKRKENQKRPNGPTHSQKPLLEKPPPSPPPFLTIPVLAKSLSSHVASSDLASSPTLDIGRDSQGENRGEGPSRTTGSSQHRDPTTYLTLVRFLAF